MGERARRAPWVEVRCSSSSSEVAAPPGKGSVAESRQVLRRPREVLRRPRTARLPRRKALGRCFDARASTPGQEDARASTPGQEGRLREVLRCPREERHAELAGQVARGSARRGWRRRGVVSKLATLLEGTGEAFLFPLLHCHPRHSDHCTLALFAPRQAIVIEHVSRKPRLSILGTQIADITARGRQGHTGRCRSTGQGHTARCRSTGTTWRRSTGD